MKRFALFLTFWVQVASAPLFAQVLSWTPTFPTRHDTITIVFDASQGNKGLLGATEVYAHTGVLISESEDASDWKYVKAGWTENIPDCKMQKEGLNQWKLSFHIESYYGVPANETITQLAFVFRNATSTQKGVAEDGSDLFIPVYESAGFNLALIQPSESPFFADAGEEVPVLAVGTEAQSLSLWGPDGLICETVTDTLDTLLIAPNAGRFDYTVMALSANGDTLRESFYYVVKGDVTIEDVPEGMVDGVNIIDEHTAVLVLKAPGKEFVYAIGDFSQWGIAPDFAMRSAPWADRWWVRLENLPADGPIRYQYLVDGDLRIADPYSTTVLDPWNDENIPASVYPDLPAYPEETNHIVSVFETVSQPFEWTDQTFQPPARGDLVIYELLIRDFVDEHSFAAVTDSLDYLVRLGINAIELMPVSEFEGNSSWGYNTSFHMALDKYYGTAEAFKNLVNAAHERGLAVIMDMVFNHAYGQNPLVRLYWDAARNRPASNNPWFNVQSPNSDFSWGYDFDHESSHTREYMDRVLAWWVDEFHVDGFRLDFTKGFTNTTGNGWAYDASRIAILKRLGTELWNHAPDTYIILEHFADNAEEKVLSSYKDGFMLWGNMNSAYRQSAMGWLNDSNRSSDLTSGYYYSRGWDVPRLVTYMESHDEPRIMYECQEYGRQSGGYDIKSLPTALRRAELDAVFFLTVPGPKMIWQFGELGYDYYLASDGYERTDPKPIRWDYYNESGRRRLYDVYAALNKLRMRHRLFADSSTQVLLRVGHNRYDRSMHFSNDTMKAVVLGNFDVAARDLTPAFQSPGWWYEYFSGDSLLVSDVNAPLTFDAGQYAIYTDKPLDTPVIQTAVNETESGVRSYVLHQNYPNPFNPGTSISYELSRPAEIRLSVFNVLGQEMTVLKEGWERAGALSMYWNGCDKNGRHLASGVYILRLEAGSEISTRKMILLE